MALTASSLIHCPLSIYGASVFQANVHATGSIGYIKVI